MFALALSSLAPSGRSSSPPINTTLAPTGRTSPPTHATTLVSSEMTRTLPTATTLASSEMTRPQSPATLPSLLPPPSYGPILSCRPAAKRHPLQPSSFLQPRPIRHDKFLHARQHVTLDFSSHRHETLLMPTPHQKSKLCSLSRLYSTAALTGPKQPQP
jgi:hypothetical protein